MDGCFSHLDLALSDLSLLLPRRPRRPPVRRSVWRVRKNKNPADLSCCHVVSLELRLDYA